MHAAGNHQAEPVKPSHTEVLMAAPVGEEAHKRGADAKCFMDTPAP